MKLVTVSQMQAIEREADAYGLTYDQMMQNAGQGLADTLLELFLGEEELQVIGLVGPGNNGGDTLVALTALLKETEMHHSSYEPAAPKHHWSDWYAAYIVARQQGRTSEDAVKDATAHMDAVLR